jgi:hypothetical protein
VARQGLLLVDQIQGVTGLESQAEEAVRSQEDENLVVRHTLLATAVAVAGGRKEEEGGARLHAVGPVAEGHSDSRH